LQVRLEGEQGALALFAAPFLERTFVRIRRVKNGSPNMNHQVCADPAGRHQHGQLRVVDYRREKHKDIEKRCRYE